MKYIKDRIGKFLDASLQEEEFSHTVMHGARVALDVCRSGAAAAASHVRAPKVQGAANKPAAVGAGAGSARAGGKAAAAGTAAGSPSKLPASPAPVGGTPSRPAAAGLPPLATPCASPPDGTPRPHKGKPGGARADAPQATNWQKIVGKTGAGGQQRGGEAGGGRQQRAQAAGEPDARARHDKMLRGARAVAAAAASPPADAEFLKLKRRAEIEQVGWSLAPASSRG